ncbi:MAG TPA: histidine kinase dimerization/phospho-acceptor domain-containing protein [Gemmatimonadaceae bacterium]
MTNSSAISICLVSGSPETRAILRESASLWAPGAAFTELAPESATKFPACTVAIVDATGDAGAAAELARGIRAGGSKAAIVLVVAGGALDEKVAARIASYGVLEQVQLQEASRALGPALERALGAGDAGSGFAAAHDELRRTQRLLAAGEIALGLQHSMNNPLTAILAEAQLLEMEELTPEIGTAVGRILENTRRLVALVRKLDVIGPKKSA